MSAAHDKALVSVLGHIQIHIVQQNEVLRLSSLRLIYVEELKRNGYENSNYRSEKLLKRLENDTIKDYIDFTKVNPDNSETILFWLVHSSSITVSMLLHERTLLETQTSMQTSLYFFAIIFSELFVSPRICHGHLQLTTWSSVQKHSCLQMSYVFSTWLCPARKTWRRVTRSNVWYSPLGKIYAVQFQKDNESYQNMSLSVRP